MQIIVPMAGRGSRFAEKGIGVPKPLIPVGGRLMVEWALESLVDVSYSRLIFIALEEHDRDFDVTHLLMGLGKPNTEVILIPDVTEGQLCTVLAAREWINEDEDILICSADTYVYSGLAHDIAGKEQECQGIISTANLPGERWSFARADENGRVLEVAEKVRISEHASTGLYYFSNGRDFVSVAEAMIANNEKTRGEYYVIPVYQKYIERGWRVNLSIAQEMWDMGTPEALDIFVHRFLAGFK